MEMKPNYRKSLKLIVLLISSLMIATVSAAVYNQLFQSGTVSTTTYGLQWIDGTDSVGLTKEGASCSMSSLTAPVDGGRNYTDPVRLNNTEASDHTFDLIIESTSGNTSHLEWLYVRLFNSTGSYKDTLTVWSGGSEGSDLSSLVIAGNDWWRFEWDIKWNTSSTITSSVDVTLRLDVTA